MPVDRFLSASVKCRYEQQLIGQMSAASSCAFIPSVETSLKPSYTNSTSACIAPARYTCLATCCNNNNNNNRLPINQILPSSIISLTPNPPPVPTTTAQSCCSGLNSLHSSNSSLNHAQSVHRSNSLHHQTSSLCPNRYVRLSHDVLNSRQASTNSLNNNPCGGCSCCISAQQLLASNDCHRCCCSSSSSSSVAVPRCGLPSRSALERSLQEAKARVAQLKQELDCNRHDHFDSRTSSVDCVHCSSDRLDSTVHSNARHTTSQYAYHANSQLATAPHSVCSSASSLNRNSTALNGSSCTVASTGSGGAGPSNESNNARDMRLKMLANYMQQATESIYARQQKMTSNAITGSSHSLSNANVPLPGSSTSLVSQPTASNCSSINNLTRYTGSQNRLQDSCSSIASESESTHTSNLKENIYSNQLSMNEKQKTAFTSCTTGPTTAVAYSKRVISVSNPSGFASSGNMLNATSNNGSGSSCSSNQSSVTSGCSTGSDSLLQQSLIEARERVAALKKDLEQGTSAHLQHFANRMQQKQLLQQQQQLQQAHAQHLEMILNRASANGSTGQSTARLLQPPEAFDDYSDSFPLYQNLANLHLHRTASNDSSVLYSRSESEDNQLNSIELDPNYDLISIIDKYYRKNDKSAAVEV